MHIFKTLLVSATMVIGSASVAFAQNAHDATQTHSTSTAAEHAVGSHLPPKFRALIIQEMFAVTDASKRILEALVRGQDEVVAKNAQDIHDSFVLAQEMTEADSKALHDALPHAFVERDQEFHELSAELADAARAGDKEEQLLLFNKMLNACIACHTAHAQDRFPSLAAGQ